MEHSFSHINRSWSEDITKAWNFPIPPGESLDERAQRYSRYFTLDDSQLNVILHSLSDELHRGLKFHKAQQEWDSRKCSLKMLDSCLSSIPTGSERGIAYSVDFGGSNVRAVRVELLGDAKLELTQSRTTLNEVGLHHVKGLLDQDATAMELFDAFATQLKSFMDIHGDLDGPRLTGVGFTFSFPIEQTELTNATLISWTKEFETGRNTDDPVEGMDVALLLDQAFWRQEVQAQTVAILNDTVGTLLSCAYEKPIQYPTCLIGVIVGTGLNGCYYQERAKDYGYKGTIINTELGNFNLDLPSNDVDLEVDYASEAPGFHLLEKMVAGKYIGEICRRLIVKVFQKDAPQLAWVRESLPPEACCCVITDESAELSLTKNIFSILWGWDLSLEQAGIIKSLHTIVFNRSAAVVAVLIIAMAKKTGRLSAGTGGLTCGLDGSLYVNNQFYQNKVASVLEDMLGERASLIHLVVSSDGSGKGAAIMAATLHQN